MWHKSKWCREPQHTLVFPSSGCCWLCWEGDEITQGIPTLASENASWSPWHFQTKLKGSYLNSGLGPRNSQDALCFKSSLLQAGQQLLKGKQKALRHRGWGVSMSSSQTPGSEDQRCEWNCRELTACSSRGTLVLGSSFWSFSSRVLSGTPKSLFSATETTFPSLYHL